MPKRKDIRKILILGSALMVPLGGLGLASQAPNQEKRNEEQRTCGVVGRLDETL